MAGIPNQPTAKPSDLPGPPSLNDFEASDGPPPLDGFEMEAPADVEAPEQSMGEKAVEYLPAALGVVGGIVGAGAGGVGAVPGAVGGAAIGQSLRRLIEINVFGKGSDSTPGQEVMGVAKEGAMEGAAQAVGLGIGKVGAKAVASKWGQKAIGAVSEMAEAPLKMLKTSINEAREKIERPVLEFIAKNTTKLNTDEAGGVVKNLLKENIKKRYGPFVQAYSDLDTVAKAVPLADESRRRFTMGLKEWGADTTAGDNWKVVKKFADSFDGASTGKQFDDIIGQIADAKDVAFRTGATKQGQFLKNLQSRAEDFMELETTKLAARVQAGKATPQEMQFLSQIVKQRGIAEPDPTKYAKSLAKDYLSAKDKVKKDYSGFRSFLEDVGEQTKLKAERKGPMAFLSNMDDVSNEKLIERMFDPKNAAALRKMQKETPEVFDQVLKTKVTELVKKASPDGNLDLFALRKEVNKLPGATKAILFKSDELKALEKTLSNQRLESLARLERRGEGMIANFYGEVLELSRLAGSKTVDFAKRHVIAVPMKRAAGKAAIGLAGAYSGPMARPEEE